MNRRDTLKLASAAAALGAGLGALFKETEAAAGVPHGLSQIKTEMIQWKQEALQLKIDGNAQIKIDGYKTIKMEKGFAQVKMYSGAGQFLYAANVPEEIANVFVDGSALQFKFFKSRELTRVKDPAGLKGSEAGILIGMTTFAQYKQSP